MPSIMVRSSQTLQKTGLDQKKKKGLGRTETLVTSASQEGKEAIFTAGSTILRLEVELESYENKPFCRAVKDTEIGTLSEKDRKRLTWGKEQEEEGPESVLFSHTLTLDLKVSPHTPTLDLKVSVSSHPHSGPESVSSHPHSMSGRRRVRI